MQLTLGVAESRARWPAVSLHMEDLDVKLKQLQAAFDIGALDESQFAEAQAALAVGETVFCWHPLSIPIEKPAKGGRGCSRMTVSPTAQAALMAKEMVSEQPQPEPAAAPSSPNLEGLEDEDEPTSPDRRCCSKAGQIDGICVGLIISSVQG